MKSRLRSIRETSGLTYSSLLFVCPGCVSGGPDGYDGIHMLPVNVKEDIGKPSWTWDGSLDFPTLSPSILTNGFRNKDTNEVVRPRCHSFLRDGVFEFLKDSEHPLASQKVPIPDLPASAENLS